MVGNLKTPECNYNRKSDIYIKSVIEQIHYLKEENKMKNYLTNKPKSIQNSTVMETCLSDFHKMSLTVLKILYKKQRPNIVRYLTYVILIITFHE